MASKPIHYQRMRCKTRFKDSLVEALERFGGDECDPRFVHKFGDGSRATYILARSEVLDEESFDIKTLQPVARRRKVTRACEFTLDFANGLLETTKKADAQVVISFLHEACPGMLEVEGLEINVPEVVDALEKQNAVKSIQQISIKSWSIREGKLKSPNLLPESDRIAHQLFKEEDLEFIRSTLVLGQPVFNAKLKVTKECGFAIQADEPEAIEEMVRTLIRQYAVTVREKDDTAAALPVLEDSPVLDISEEVVRSNTRKGSSKKRSRRS